MFTVGGVGVDGAVRACCHDRPLLLLREPSILVSHHPIQAGDVGSIVVGGRPTLIDYHLNAQKRLLPMHSSCSGKVCTLAHLYIEICFYLVRLYASVHGMFSGVVFKLLFAD